MTISLYKLTCDPRVVNKSSYLTAAQVWVDQIGSEHVAIGTLRTSCSETDPRITFEIPNDKTDLFNYLYIAELAKYYFVRDKIMVRSGLLEVICHEDVLMTWHNAITSSSGYILRSESGYNDFIVDPKRILSTRETVSIIDHTYPLGNPLNPTSNAATDYNYVITLANDPGISGNTGYTSTDWDVFPGVDRVGQGKGSISWAIKGSTLTTIVSKLLDSTFVNQLDNAIYGDKMQGVIKLIVYPFGLDYSSVAAATVSDVTVFNHAFNAGAIQGYKIYPNAVAEVDFGTFYKSASPTDFMDFEPYSRATLYLPYYGLVDIPMRYLVEGGISIKYRINVISGQCMIRIMTPALSGQTETYVRTLTCNLAEEVPLTQSNVVDQGKNYINSTIGMAAGLLTMYSGNLDKGIMAIGNSLIQGMSNPLIMSGSAAEPNLSKLLRYDPYILITKQNDVTPASFAHYRGKPVEKVDTIGSYTGYTEVSEIYQESTPGLVGLLSQEWEELKALLRNGVIL